MTETDDRRASRAGCEGASLTNRPTGHGRDVGLSDAGFVAYFSLLLPSLLILHGGLLLDHAFTYLLDRLSHMCLMPDTVASATYVPMVDQGYTFQCRLSG